MDGLLPLITGFGLAAGAGGRASLVALLLGICHTHSTLNWHQFRLACQYSSCYSVSSVQLKCGSTHTQILKSLPITRPICLHLWLALSHLQPVLAKWTLTFYL